eukprot:2882968-Pleurochrysis_carterae.AAC.3
MQLLSLPNHSFTSLIECSQEYSHMVRTLPARARMLPLNTHRAHERVRVPLVRHLRAHAPGLAPLQLSA